MIEAPNPGSDPMAAARQARLAALAQSRNGNGNGNRNGTGRRRHPAQGARIVAAGLGATTMLGLVGVMGYSQHATATSAPAPAPAQGDQPPVVIVVHRGFDPTATDPAAAPTDTTPATTLRARPSVRPASPQAQAPAASTSGSR